MKNLSISTAILLLVNIFSSTSTIHVHAFHPIRARATGTTAPPAPPSVRASSSHVAPKQRRSNSSIFSSSSSSSTTNTNNNNVPSSDDLDWKALAKDVFSGKDKRPVILFDGVCNLCNGGVNFALDNDSIGRFRFASLQSTVGKALLLRSGKKANDISSIVLVTKEKSFFKSDAVLRIATGLDGNLTFPIVGRVGRVVPPFMRNVVYDFVANNRYRFGESDQCRLDFGEFDDRFFHEGENE
jgi:predicted DCC family thiol-disulfide oxidoreductase YuxK